MWQGWHRPWWSAFWPALQLEEVSPNLSATPTVVGAASRTFDPSIIPNPQPLLPSTTGSTIQLAIPPSLAPHPSISEIDGDDDSHPSSMVISNETSPGVKANALPPWWLLSSQATPDAQFE